MPSPSSQADRNKASRLRKKARLTAAERGWLDAYDGSRKRGRGGQSGPRAPHGAQEVPPPSPAIAPPPELAHAPTPAPAPAATPGMVPVDFGGAPMGAPLPIPPPAPNLGSGPSAPLPGDTAPGSVPTPHVCNVGKDCPACRSQTSGALVCSATGKKVWPPMSEAGAEAMAAVIFAGLGFVLQFFRDDRRIIMPSADERRMLAGALREVAYRRASWVGAVDDLFALFGALGRYTIRAMNEPQKQLPPKDPSQQEEKKP